MPSRAQHLSTKPDSGVDFNVCQCLQCGLIQLDSSPVDYYQDIIRSSGISKEMLEHRYNQFNQFIQTFDLQGKNLVEIGSGGGEHLQILENLNINATGFNITNGLPCNKFDAFLLLNVLEHLPDPTVMIQSIRQSLTPQGVGIIEVPNFDMMVNKGMVTEFMTDHLLYFDKSSLTLLLENNGFDMISCNSVWKNYTLHAVVKKRHLLEISNFQTGLAETVRKMKQFLYNNHNKKIAIWGAGHQAFAIMALTNLTPELISYVVDDAPFKQNKLTPSTNIPIVSAECLTSDPVDVILIMGGGYSDEIAKKIGKMNGKTKYNIW